MNRNLFAAALMGAMLSDAAGGFVGPRHDLRPSVRAKKKPKPKKKHGPKKGTKAARQNARRHR